MASCPKSFELLESVYASSIKSVPPIAEEIISSVFIAVCPEYPATSFALSTSTKCPLEIIPSSLKILLSKRATVVFPVPGFPVNTECNGF